MKFNCYIVLNLCALISTFYCIEDKNFVLYFIWTVQYEMNNRLIFKKIYQWHMLILKNGRFFFFC